MHILKHLNSFKAISLINTLQISVANSFNRNWISVSLHDLVP